MKHLVFKKLGLALKSLHAGHLESFVVTMKYLSCLLVFDIFEMINNKVITNILFALNSEIEIFSRL